MVLKAGQTQGGGLPRRQAAVVADEPTQRLLHLAKGGRDLHQFPQLNGAAEVARRRHQHRKHHRCLAIARVEPGVAFLHPEQAHEVVEHQPEARLQRGALDCCTSVEGNGFAVFAHAHQVVAKVGFVALLRKVERGHGFADPVADQAARQGVGQGHPHHEAGEGEGVFAHRKTETARQTPQDADKAQQGDRGVEQPQAQAHRVGGELLDVLLNALVGVVGAAWGGWGGAMDSGVSARGSVWTDARLQLELVEGVVGEPALQVVVRHPRPPAQLQQLGQIKAVHRHQDEAGGQPGKHAELVPKHLGVALLQRVVKHAVPVVEQDHQVDHAQVQAHAGGQQTTGTPLVAGVQKIGRRQRPHTAQLQAALLPMVGHAVADSSRGMHGVYAAVLRTPLATWPAGT